MATPESIAAHFGYTDDWLRLGVVTQSELQQQFAEFQTSEDKNTEHYRCAVFLNYLNRIDGVSDETLHGLLALTDSGSDGCDLALNRAFELVRSDVLTDSQLQTLREQPRLDEHSSFRRAVDRVVVDRRLASDGLTDQIFHDICVLNDASTIRRLLDRDDLTRDHVAWIVEHACNKRLRNIATQRLNSRRFKASG